MNLELHKITNNTIYAAAWLIIGHQVALQMWNGSYHRVRFSENGKDYVNLRQVREQLSFAKMWAGNLKDRGLLYF